MKILCVIIIIGMLGCPVKAQHTPGGVSGYTLWLEAETFNDTTIEKTVSDPVDLQASYFNYNPVLDVPNTHKLHYGNTIKERFTFFAAFKSDSDTEKAILNLKYGKSITYLTNKALLSDKEFIYTNVNSTNGMLISYISGGIGKGKQRNSIELIDFYNGDKEGKEQLMELICFDRLLTPIERQKVETYLSVKYGISLIGESDYFNSEGEKVWIYKDNIAYNKRVTAIGRDDALYLYQKQSGNAEKDGLYIGLGILDTTNAHNKFSLKDKTFLFWGDNGGAASLTKDKSGTLHKMQRTWKVQLRAKELSDTISTQVVINKNEMAFAKNPKNKDEFIWMVIHQNESSSVDCAQAKYYKQSIEDEGSIRFNNVVWDIDKSGTDYFTFIKGPDFYFDYNSKITCGISAKGVLGIKLIGGTAPYNITLTSPVRSEAVTISDDYHEFLNLSHGSYDVKVTDSTGKLYRQTIILKPSLNFKGSLAGVWQLQNNEVAVTPEIPAGTDSLYYEWKKEGQIVSTDKVFIAKLPGEYSLTLYNAEGCAQEFPFTVTGQDIQIISGWTLYPNPVASSESYTLQFNLDKESLVSVRVNSIEGKLISEKSLGIIQDYEYKSFISTSGIYLITVIVDNVPQAVSLIVK